MENEKLIEELKRSFENLRNELGFKSTYKEIEEVGFIEDMVLSEDYVSPKLARRIINRLIDKYYSWIGFIHSLIMPSPQDMIYTSEHKELDSNEKKELFGMIKKIMYLVRKCKRLAFEKSKEEEGMFIDELVKFDNEYFNPLMLKYHKKFEDAWKKEQ
jgi:hypothetical protein